MTALRPVDSWDVTPVEPDEERKLLRKVVVNPVCAHPDCGRPTESVHHLFPRGTVGSSSWFIRVGGVDKPILHCVGLCGSGTTGHHGDLEEHRGWAKYEDGLWNWYDRSPQPTKEDGTTPEDEWFMLGPLNPQPGQTNPAKKKITRKKGQEKRARRTISIAVPADEQEDGAGILDDLIRVCREEWGPEMGWTEKVPAYYVLVAAMAKALQ